MFNLFGYNTPPNYSYDQDQDNSLFLTDFSDDIDNIIVNETNIALYELGQDIENINDTYKSLALIVDNQGEKLLISEENIIKSTDETEIGLNSLAVVKNKKIKFFRDTAIIVLGGIVGLSGFVLGPIVGIGSVVAGLTIGSATVYGTHKKFDR